MFRYRKSHLPFLALVSASLLMLLFLAGAAGAGEDKDEEATRLFINHPKNLFVGANAQGAWTSLFTSERGFLGVRLVDLTPELMQHFGVDRKFGSLISQVIEGSPAEAAALAVGDIITRIDDEDQNKVSLHLNIRQREEGDRAEIEYWRDGRPGSTVVEIGKNEDPELFGKAFMDLQDLGELFGGEAFLGGGTMPLHLEGVEEALEAAKTALQNMDWSQHLKQLEELDLSTLDVRMEKLQEKMKELEKRLEEDFNDRE